jgi:nucleotide-binding universal stress UspA family protein
MIKTILVAADGAKEDLSAFEVALALARPLDAHLDFYHVRITPDQSAALEPHVDFAQGRGLAEALDRLQRDAETRSIAARRLTREFCERHHLSAAEPGGGATGVTYAWLEERNDPVRRFIYQARHHDLAILGRPARDQRFRRGLNEQLLLASGRPVVIAPRSVPRTVGTVAMIGWKETPEAGRALTAALPILVNAQRVILTRVEDGDGAQGRDLDDLAKQLAWHGITAEMQAIGADGRSVAQRLHAAAEAAHADLLVIGAYGHSRIRNLIFGGVTEAFLDGASLPVFLAH